MQSAQNNIAPSPASFTSPAPSLSAARNPFGRPHVSVVVSNDNHGIPLAVLPKLLSKSYFVSNASNLSNFSNLANPGAQYPLFSFFFFAYKRYEFIYKLGIEKRVKNCFLLFCLKIQTTLFWSRFQVIKSKKVNRKQILFSDLSNWLCSYVFFCFFFASYKVF